MRGQVSSAWNGRVRISTLTIVHICACLQKFVGGKLTPFMDGYLRTFGEKSNNCRGGGVEIPLVYSQKATHVLCAADFFPPFFSVVGWRVSQPQLDKIHGTRVARRGYPSVAEKDYFCAPKIVFLLILIVGFFSTPHRVSLVFFPLFAWKSFYRRDNRDAQGASGPSPAVTKRTIVNQITLHVNASKVNAL